MENPSLSDLFLPFPGAGGRTRWKSHKTFPKAERWGGDPEGWTETFPNPKKSKLHGRGVARTVWATSAAVGPGLSAEGPGGGAGGGR